MFDISPWIVTITAFLMTVVVFTHDERKEISIKVFALSGVSQVLVYLFFSLNNLPPETRQFMARLNIVAVDLALIIILLTARIKNGH